MSEQLEIERPSEVTTLLHYFVAQEVFDKKKNKDGREPRKSKEELEAEVNADMQDLIYDEWYSTLAIARHFKWSAVTAMKWLVVLEGRDRIKRRNRAQGFEWRWNHDS